MSALTDKVIRIYDLSLGDAHVIKAGNDLIDMIIDPNSKFEDDVDIEQVITVGQLRKLEGFHMHHGVMHLLIGLMVAGFHAQLSIKLGVLSAMTMQDAMELRQHAIDQADRCLPRIMRQVKERHGVPSNVPTKQLDDICTHALAHMDKALEGSVFAPYVEKVH